MNLLQWHQSQSNQNEPQPSRTEPILGYRWWWAFRAGNGNPGLRSWVWNVCWRVPGVTEALHWNQAHSQFVGGVTHMLPVPAEKCRCGIYAWFRLPTALTDISRFNEFYGDKLGLSAIAGAVVTGGETILHEDEGMRVQFARPVAFAQAELGTAERQLLGTERLFQDLAAAFGVPLMPLDKLESYAREFGVTIAEAS